MYKAITLLVGLCICLGVRAGEINFPDHSYRINSRFLQEERIYKVALPKSYHQSPHKNYPVLYILDGQKHFLHSVSTTSFLADSGQIPEMIVVAIDSTIRIRDFTPTDWQAWEGGGGAKHFLSFLSTELIPTIDDKFRTGKLRIVFGHSAGALFVLYSLYAAPDLFDAYLASDGSFEWDNKIVERELARMFEAGRSLQKYVHFTSSQLVDVEPEFDYFASLELMFREKSPQGLRWRYQAFQDESHASIALLGLIHALKDLFGTWQVPDQIMTLGFESVQDYFQSIAGQVGASEFIPEDVLNSLGYRAIESGNSDEAIRIFKLNIKNYPSSANAFDSLADAYVETGSLIEAVRAVRKSVVLATQFKHPNLKYFNEKLARLDTKLDKLEDKN